mmetsp:Transcript_72548/g.161217  ORF Transcript_72548/g.161217 Transcript_72548/m.161217 type:complete len:328 (+) Transcript_72548:246-1229(+)
MCTFLLCVLTFVGTLPHLFLQREVKTGGMAHPGRVLRRARRPTPSTLTPVQLISEGMPLPTAMWERKCSLSTSVRQTMKPLSPYSSSLSTQKRISFGSGPLYAVTWSRMMYRSDILPLSLISAKIFSTGMVMQGSSSVHAESPKNSFDVGERKMPIAPPFARFPSLAIFASASFFAASFAAAASSAAFFASASAAARAAASGSAFANASSRAFSAFSSRAFLSAFSCSFAASRAASSRASFSALATACALASSIAAFTLASSAALILASSSAFSCASASAIAFAAASFLAVSGSCSVVFDHLSFSGSIVGLLLQPSYVGSVITGVVE